MGSSPHESAPPQPAPPAGGGYAELFRAVTRQGLMERRPGRYVVRIAVTAVLFAATAVAFVLIGDSWWQLVTAAVFAALFVQCGFIGHDAGHLQIFSSRWWNNAVGYLHGDLLIGLGYGWWVDKHNAHHANPNHEDRDPDVNFGTFAFTTDQSDGARAPARGPLGRFVIRHQAALFFPLLLLEGVDLHVTAVRSVAGRRIPAPGLEGVLLTLHAVVYFTAVFTVLSPVTGVVFVLVQQGLFGLYLGSSFAPGHKGMPMPTAAERLDPVRRQVITSRNIRGGRVVDIALGGLNYQIEHHLFPRMPRSSLRHAQPLVREFCERHAIAYTETTLFGSYVRGLRHLHEASAPARG